MPRFYFDLRENGTFIEDEEGMSLPDLAAAKYEAAVTAAEIGRDRLPEGGLQSVTIDVRDENGRQPTLGHRIADGDAIHPTRRRQGPQPIRRYRGRRRPALGCR